MSDATLHNLERAIEEHFHSELDSDDSDERHGAVIINWVVGFTISNIVNVDGKEIVGYNNGWYAATGDPNAATALTDWVSDDIADIFAHD